MGWWWVSPTWLPCMWQSFLGWQTWFSKTMGLTSSSLQTFLTWVKRSGLGAETECLCCCGPLQGSFHFPRETSFLCVHMCVRGWAGVVCSAWEDFCKRSFSRLANPARLSVEFIMFGFPLWDFWDTMVYFIFLLQGYHIRAPVLADCCFVSAKSISWDSDSRLWADLSTEIPK